MVYGDDSELRIFVLHVGLPSSSEHGVSDNIMSVTKWCIQNTSSISLTDVRCRSFYFSWCKQTFLLNAKSSQYEIFSLKHEKIKLSSSY